MRTVRRFTLMLALIGSAATALAGGGLAVAAALSAAVILGSMLGLPQPRPAVIERWRLINLTLLIAGLIAIAVRVDPLSVVAGGLALLAAHRAWTAVQAAGLQALLLVVVLQVMLASRLVSSPWMPASVSLLVLLAPAALALISLGRWQLRTAGLGAVAGAIGLAIAASVPPPEGPPVDGEVHAVGFSRQITLGDLSALHDDRTPILTLTDDGAGSDRYLHGITLDRFTGHGWASTAPHAAAPLPIDLVGRRLISQQVTLQPLTEGVLLGRAPLVSIEGLEGAWRDEVGTWRVSGPLRPVQYTAFSLTAPLYTPLAEPGRWLGLPADLDPQVRTLAAALTIEGSAEEQAAHLIDWLLAEFTYTRVPVPGTARQPLSDFLFVTRTGHCEYFAAALAVLLRAQGIPSRIVNGLRGGERQDDGSVVFRQRDAHAWVELHAPGVGWMRLDPTPPDLSDEAAAPPVLETAVMPTLSEVEVPLEPFLALLAGVAVFGVVRWRRPSDPALRRYRRALKLVRQRGWEIPTSLPPVSAAEWLVEHAGPAAEAMRTLAWALYRHRYGGEGSALGEMDVALKDLQSLPRCG